MGSSSWKRWAVRVWRTGGAECPQGCPGLRSKARETAFSGAWPGLVGCACGLLGLSSKNHQIGRLGPEGIQETLPQHLESLSLQHVELLRFERFRSFHVRAESRVVGSSLDLGGLALARPLGRQFHSLGSLLLAQHLVCLPSHRSSPRRQGQCRMA